MKKTDTFGMLKLAAHQRGRHQMSGRDSRCAVVRPVISDGRGLDCEGSAWSDAELITVESLFLGRGPVALEQD